MTKSGAGGLQLIYLPQARSDLISYADGSVLKCGLARSSDTCSAWLGLEAPRRGRGPLTPDGLALLMRSTDIYLPAVSIGARENKSIQAWQGTMECSLMGCPLPVWAPTWAVTLGVCACLYVHVMPWPPVMSTAISL